ncbi:Ti-type conjugative transfer relaxase TraA [Sphingomonas changbaiensis]|nr:Ti-type conjugative transfer relaxase TraA [Sphingomonas changbaiensis]
MAIYHFSAKIISRANGSGALAAAAYRSASRLHDQRLDRHHDFSNKAGVVHSEVMLPDGAPEHLGDREQLWNAVEAAEKRIDAQLAREIEFAIPRELTKEQGVTLAHDFVQREFVDRSMIADLNVHWDMGADGLTKPHAHVMLATREVGEEGFGAKVRDWNRTDLLNHWREAWADHVNERLAELDIDAHVDHRSLEAQGIGLEPQNKIGPAASRMAEQGRASERLVEHQAIARANGERIIAHPEIALDAITHSQATFTTRDLAMFVHRHTDGKEQFDHAMAAVRSAPELIKLGRDGRGEERFTSRTMLEIERRLDQATASLMECGGHGIPAAALESPRATARMRGLVLGEEQEAALRHITRPGDLASIVGYAGTGKSALLGIAREGWERGGYRVQGLALSGIAAENLEAGSGIASRTIASLEHQWAQGRDLLTSKDILVIDEAGMIGTRQMERIIAEAEKRRAKVVLVGDPEQLQAIEAGAAFRSIAERHGAVEITEVRRQREGWQREATRQLATGRTGAAIEAYAERGMVHAAPDRAAARESLIERWNRERSAEPGASRLILTHTRDEVRLMNERARDRLRATGELGEDVVIATERGERRFAAGDRAMFLKNERGLGVKNGTLGTVRSITSVRMAVMLDDGRAVAFDFKDYAHLDHGYAATIHKAQGITVDRAHVLATPGLDRHAAYVALSRHRDAVQLHYGEDDFADAGQLARTLSRDRSKDMVADYARHFADRREIRMSQEGIGKEKARPLARDPFAGLNLRTTPIPVAPLRTPLDRAVEHYARAQADILRVRQLGMDTLPHQQVALNKAAEALNALRPEAARDLRNAFVANRPLIDDAAKGRTAAAIRAMQLEAELRTNPECRADRFVQQWQELHRQHAQCNHSFDEAGARRASDALTSVAKALHRDPQLESLLRKRVHELGIPAPGGASLSQSLQDWIGRSRSRGIGI